MKLSFCRACGVLSTEALDTEWPAPEQCGNCGFVHTDEVNHIYGKFEEAEALLKAANS